MWSADGEDNEKYGMETLRGGLKSYDRVVFLEMGLGGEEAAKRQAREHAEREGWRFEAMAGDLSLVEKLLSGEWDEDFAVIEPGQALASSHDEVVMRCVQCQSG